MADLAPPQPSWWARFRVSPRWAQAAAWILFTPLPVLLLASHARQWLVRVIGILVAAALAIMWLTAAAVVAIQLGPPVITFIAQRPLSLWIAVGVSLATLGLLYAIVFLLPTRLVAPGTLTEEQLLKARNDARSALLTALTLGGAFVAAYVGLRQIDLGREELRQNLEASRRTLELTREGQITERFTRAVDQLGSEKLDVRLGGIYALERIARDSEADHGPIMEILTAFLREHARQNSQSPPRGAEAPNVDRHGEAATVTDQTGPSRPRADLEAALTVISRRDRHHDKPDTKLDLSQIYIPRAALAGANLQGAILADANLQDASLGGANLQYAFLFGANLQGADLQDASLSDASLLGADLRGAELGGADLREAQLVGPPRFGRPAILSGARADQNTKWPEDFDPAAAGVVIRQDDRG